jgi:hypothetical protein
MQHNMDVVSFQKEKGNNQRTSFLLTGKYIHPTRVAVYYSNSNY